VQASVERVDLAAREVHLGDDAVVPDPTAGGERAPIILSYDALVVAASCDLFELTEEDLIDRVKGIITVGEFELAAGGQILFT
jgi:hypothetical protein